MKSKIRLVLGIALAAVLGLALFTFAMFQGDELSWFLFFAYLPIFIYEIGGLFDPLAKWQIKRSLSRHFVQAGESIEVTLEIKRKWPYPIFYTIVEEVFSDPIHHVSLKEASSHNWQSDTISYRRMKRLVLPFASRRLELSYQLDHLPRGEHHLQAVRLLTSDLFGLIKKERVFPVHDLFLVYPNEARLSLKTKQALGEGGFAKPATAAAANMVSGVRSYAPGDRLALIDWKQTARRQSLMTKEFDSEVRSEVLLILDACGYEGMNRTAFEITIEVALGLIGEFQQLGRLSFMTISEEAAVFPLDAGRQNPAVLDHLARLEAGKRYPFALKLKEKLMKLNGNMYISIVTTQLTEMLKETMLRSVDNSRHFTLVYVQSAANMESEQESLQQLDMAGVDVLALTEYELAKLKDEVEAT